MIKNGILTSAIFQASPHYNLRPADTEINLLVIHCASLPEGDYDNNNIEQLFTGQMTSAEQQHLGLTGDVRVSSHLFVKRDGGVIQFVNFNHRAWHAGTSEFQGQADCNNFSIGIELQGAIRDQYTDSQYTALISITQHILKIYKGISKDRIVGHSDIAPVRKSDPGELFNWGYYLQNI